MIFNDIIRINPCIEALCLHWRTKTNNKKDLKVSRKGISTNSRIFFSITLHDKTFFDLLISLLILWYEPRHHSILVLIKIWIFQVQILLESSRGA